MGRLKGMLVIIAALPAVCRPGRLLDLHFGHQAAVRGTVVLKGRRSLELV